MAAKLWTLFPGWNHYPFQKTKPRAWIWPTVEKNCFPQLVNKVPKQ